MRCFFLTFSHFIHCYRTLSVIAAAVFLCPLLLADTTWVAGDVYGVWDTTGSPYMMTDTITVPLDSTLRIRPGVEIYFLDQEIRETPVLVHGRLLAVGAENDSVYFISPNAPFGKFSNENTLGSEIRLEYCVVDSTMGTISSDRGIFVAKRCRFSWSPPNGNTIYNNGPGAIDTVQYCKFDGCQWHPQGQVLDFVIAFIDINLLQQCLPVPGIFPRKKWLQAVDKNWIE